MRVRVMSGNRETSLGEGEIVGYETVYVIGLDEGPALENTGRAFLSLDDPTIRPSYSFVKEIGGTLIEIPDNPKIQLDSGDIVYGAQVWWTVDKGES